MDHETQEIAEYAGPHLKALAAAVRKEVSEREGSTNVEVTRGGLDDEMSAQVRLNPLTGEVTLWVHQRINRDHKRACKVVVHLNVLEVLRPGQEYPEPKLVWDVDDLRALKEGVR
jgi:hypothetical protein